MISQLLFPQISNFTLSKIEQSKMVLMVSEESNLVASNSLNNTGENKKFVHESNYHTRDANVVESKNQLILNWQEKHHEAWERRFQQFLSHAKNLQNETSPSRSSASEDKTVEKKLLQLQFKMTNTKCLKNKIQQTWRCQFYFTKDKNLL
jgi:hypothetical protein